MDDLERLKARRALYIAKGRFSIPTVVACPACLMGLDIDYGFCLEEITSYDIARDVLKSSGKPYQVSLSW